MQALVIFDCDGVLVDSERLSHTVLMGLLSEHGVQLSFEATVRQFIGTSLPVCRERVAALLGGTLPDSFFPQFTARSQAAFRAELVEVPGVRQLIAALPCAYCVASNGNRAKVDFTLAHTGLLSLFTSRIFTADDVRHPKPAPDLFLHAAQQMGAQPATTTVIEDTPTGITAAKAAGMRAIGYCAMTPADELLRAGADGVAASMAEVKALVCTAAGA